MLGGVLKVGNNSASGTLGSGAVVNAAEVIFSRSNSFTMLNDLAGSGTWRKQGGGTLTLADDNNTFTGLFELEGGTLKGGIANAFSASGRINMAAGTTLDLGGFSQTVAGLSGNGTVTSTGLSSAVLTQSSALSTVFSGVISDGLGKTSLVKAGTGTLTLTGENTFTGTTLVNGGTLQVGNGSTAGSLGTGNVVMNGGTLVFARSDGDNVSGDISGTGSITKLGAGTLLFTGTNSFSGTTTISGGTLELTKGLGSGSIVNNATLIFDSNSDIAIGNAISGSGLLRKQGTGVATLDNAAPSRAAS